MHTFKPISKVLYLVSLIYKIWSFKYNTYNLQNTTPACYSDLKAENWVAIGFYLFGFSCLLSTQDSGLSFVSAVHFCVSVQRSSICSLRICACSFRRSLWFTRGTWVSGITLKGWKPFECFHVFLQSLYYLDCTYLHIFFSTVLPLFPVCGLSPTLNRLLISLLSSLISACSFI